jgi:heme oxygenase (biliverdin-producing, ferredoxin)
VSETAQTALSLALGKETRDLHRSAERSRTMGALLRGDLSIEAYTSLLRNLHAVYDAMEAALPRQADTTRLLLGWLDDPALARAGSIAEDLVAFHGSGWALELPLLPSTQEWLERIEELEETWPIGLVAHAWVRYMGDVSGGQILARIVRKHYLHTHPVATRSYEFPGLDDIEGFKTEFRRRLDELDPSLGAPLITEARTVFGFSIRMLHEVGST